MISFEYRTGVIRGGRDHKKHGDPYEWSCTLVVQDGTAEIIGLAGKRFSKDDHDAIIEWCKQAGYKRLFYDRVVDGVKQRFEFEL